MKELGQRLIFGSIGIALLIVFLILVPYGWFHPLVAVGVAIVASIGVWEFYTLARLKGFRPAMTLGLIATWFYVAVFYVCRLPFAQPYDVQWLGPVTSLAIVVLFFCFRFFMRRQDSLANLAISLLGLLYVVIPLALVIDVLYYLPLPIRSEGRYWFIFIVGVTVAADMGAYFVGRWIGKHRLAPGLSPGKTYEGTIGGFIAGMIAAMIIYPFGQSLLSWWATLIFALVLAVLGQIGDLAESLFKRDAGAKDSNKIPALGGILDILDSLIFNIPFTLIVLTWLYRMAG